MIQISPSIVRFHYAPMFLLGPFLLTRLTVYLFFLLAATLPDVIINILPAAWVVIQSCAATLLIRRYYAFTA